jgi:hypothetical protein
MLLIYSHGKSADGTLILNGVRSTRYSVLQRRSSWLYSYSYIHNDIVKT